MIGDKCVEYINQILPAKENDKNTSEWLYTNIGTGLIVGGTVGAVYGGIKKCFVGDSNHKVTNSIDSAMSGTYYGSTYGAKISALYVIFHRSLEKILSEKSNVQPCSSIIKGASTGVATALTSIFYFKKPITSVLLGTVAGTSHIALDSPETKAKLDIFIKQMSESTANFELSNCFMCKRIPVQYKNIKDWFKKKVQNENHRKVSK